MIFIINQKTVDLRQFFNKQVNTFLWSCEQKEKKNKITTIKQKSFDLRQFFKIQVNTFLWSCEQKEKKHDYHNKVEDCRFKPL